jgi:hypothetical protein
MYLAPVTSASISPVEASQRFDSCSTAFIPLAGIKCGVLPTSAKVKETMEILDPGFQISV